MIRSTKLLSACPYVSKSFVTRPRALPLRRAPHRHVPTSAARMFGPLPVCFADDKAAENTAITAVDTIPVTFMCTHQVNYGEHVRVVGSTVELGGWEVDTAPEMQWSEGHLWTATVELPANSQVQYKFVHVQPGQPPVWEFTPNRQLQVSGFKVCAAGCWNVEAADIIISDEEPRTSDELEPSAFMAPPSFKAILEMTETETGSFDEVDGNSTSEHSDASSPVAQLFNAVLTKEVVVEPSAGEGDEEMEVKGEGELAIADETDEAEAKKPAEAAAKANSDMFKSAAKTAGAVALGVAGAAVLSAFAVDLTEVAVMGAVAAAAGSAALSGGSKGSSVKTKASGDGEEGEERALNAEPGVVIAAGIMSAFDTGKAILGASSFSSAPPASPVAGVEEEIEETTE